MAASSRVDFTISPESIREIDQLALGLAAGFDEKRINRALQKASDIAAKSLVKPMRANAPKRTGRLRRAIWSQPVMRGKPGAYVGIRAGKSRADQKGAYYRWIVTSGVSRVPYVITPKRRSGAQALSIPGIGLRLSANRTQRIPGRPFVTDTVNRNFNQTLRIFSENLAAIIQAGIPSKGRITIPKPR
jgi:hypothetical protein